MPCSCPHPAQNRASSGILLPQLVQKAIHPPEIKYGKAALKVRYVVFWNAGTRGSIYNSILPRDMKKFTPFVAVLACASLLSGRQLDRSCGTYTNNWREELYLHRQAEAAQPKTKLLRQASRPSSDIGNIAHLEASDGVVARRNPYNINGRTVRFVPSSGARSYRVQTTGATYDETLASSGTLQDLDDDDSRELRLPFAFPYFGAEYRSLFLNSDGNLTFGKGDADITDRSLGRFLAGTPRIAPQFNDLDPTHATGGVKVRSESNRVTISWHQVPEYSGTGRGPMQTFQVRLFRDGLIEFAYLSGNPTEAVTGISPGGLPRDAALVSFAGESATGEYTAGIAERFSSAESLDIFSAAQKFYQNHDDAYDYLVIYNTMNIDAGATAVAYEVTVRNNRRGYGDVPAEVGEQAGSKERLQAVLNMGPLTQYPRDPYGRVPARQSVGDTPMSVIAHEMGHLFLAYVSVEDAAGELPMLGYQSAHWDFKFNSDASLMEGNRIVDNGAAASPRFLTSGAVEAFSPLDQYLMGLRAPEEVPDSFYVKNTRGASTTGLPRVGVAFDGDRVNVSLRDIISEAGRRTPDHTVAQRQFRLAFLVVTPEGQVPSAEDLAQVEAYRSELTSYFEKVTNQRATADTTLRRSVTVSSFPALGVVAGATAPVTVSVEQPASEAITFQLSSRSGLVRTPETVTIPIGATQATINVTGVSEGADDLSIKPANLNYDAVISRVQVSRTANLQLSVVSDASPVKIRVTDVNELPYPGVTVRAAASAGGSLDRASAISGADGTAEFQWTQTTQSANTITASVAGGPTTTISAAAAPSFSVAGIVNAASYVTGLVPGGIATLFGANLGGDNAQVLVNNSSVDVLFANGGQVNFVVPATVPEGTADVVIRAGNAASPTIQVPVRAAQPGLFFNTATNVGAITRAGSALLTTDDPPTAGDFISIYATGLGAVRIGASGLDETTGRPEVLIGGVPAEVSYSGVAPGFIGLYQVNAKIPAGIAAGQKPVVVSMGGTARSNEVLIRVR
jgi:uncharacterized protein (TIGR03437 family)